MEEHREQIKVQQLMSKKDAGGGGGGGGGRMGGNMGGRGPHTPGGGRPSQPQDEGWNTVPISKNRPIDTTRLSKITKVKFKLNMGVFTVEFCYLKLPAASFLILDFSFFHICLERLETVSFLSQ